MKKPKIIYVDSGIGNRFEDNGDTIIELNKALLQYPELYRKVLDHELRHTNKMISKKDLVTDFGESKIATTELLNFMLRNPKSFKQFLPLYYSKKWGWIYDLNLIMVYAILIAGIMVVWEIV